MIYHVAVLGASGRMGKEVCDLATKRYPVDDDFFDLGSAETANIWVDFSQPDATMNLLPSLQIPIVIGTTGFSPAQMEEIRQHSKRIGILVAPNLSPGMNHLVKILRTSGLVSDANFDIAATETHHVHKKDSPSGTLKRLLGILGERGRKEVQTHSLRLGEVLGQHSLKFVSNCEEITISHEVLDRRVFAYGALQAAHRLLKRNEPGFYRLEDLL